MAASESRGGIRDREAISKGENRPHPDGVRKLGRYLLEAELGRGTMGVVYRALDPELGRTVALKTVQLAFAVSEGERADFEKRFVAEARAAARLAHPGIVVVHDAGRDPERGDLFIAFEHLEGRTLAELTAAGAAMEWRRALVIAARLARALHHAHARGVVHRDIKPSNVMLLEGGEPKIMDFGIAKLPTERLTAAGQFWGTPAYMSPEQTGVGSLDGRSDLFSLGAVLYLLLTGRPAFEADSVPTTFSRVLFHDPPPPSHVVPGLPSAVDRVVARVLAKKPEHRHADGEALASDLDAILRGDEPEKPEQHDPMSVAPSAARVVQRSASSREAAPRVPGPRGIDRLRQRRPVVLGLSAAAGLALVALLVLGRTVPVLPIGTPASSRLSIDLEHSLKSGTLKVWIDDELRLEEPLESRVKEDLLLLKLRSGRERQEIEVPPGDHEVRLQVVSSGFTGSQLLRATFVAGETRRLRARLAGLLRKELSVAWAPTPEANEQEEP